MHAIKELPKDLTTELLYQDLPTISASNLIRKEIWINFSTWIYFYLHYWFFINLQMRTEWAFAFLNTAIIIFCLRYSLNIPHQAPSTQHPSFQNSDGDISQHRHRKIILTFFFSCDFTIVTAGVFTYYRVCLSFPGPQAKFSWVFQVY